MPQTFVVSTLNDEAFDSGDLTDETDDGNGLSFREALALAQDGDTITFDNSLSGGTSTLSGTQLTITQDGLIIDGDLDNDGSADITIDANGSSRVIELAAGSEADVNDLTIDGLAITGGYTNETGQNGGGILLNTDTNTTITNSTISGNGVYGDNSGGGGIYANGGSTLDISNSTVSNNYAFISGAGINSRGDLTISNSSISDNTAVQTGGGIAHFNGSTLAIVSTTVSGNEAGGFGGGVFTTGEHAYIYNASFIDNDANLSGGGLYLGLGADYGEIVNSTFYSNSAGQTGGGVSTDTNGTNIIHSTFTGNTANTSGGGLRNAGTATVGNSIIAGNWVTGAGTTDEVDSSNGTTTYSGVNIFTNQGGGVGDGDDILVSNLTTVFASTANQEGNIFGVLADNGGPVETVSILSTGVAFNAGDGGILPADLFDLDGDMNSGEDLPVDARGFSRVVSGLVDIGAIELDQITGTEGADNLGGTAFDDVINGLGGDDTLRGLDGDDQLFSGFGDDRADGGAGADLIRTGPGNDTLIGGTGDDTLGASNRTDLVRGGDGDDLGLGSNGNDRLFGDAGNDTLLGGNGRDTLTGGEGADRLVGGAQDDTASYADAASGVQVRLWNSDGIAGEAAGDVLIDIEDVIGSAFNDSLSGDAGDNRIDGGAGDDIIQGLDGADQLIGGAGDDTLTGGFGDDSFQFFASAPGEDVITDFEAGAGSDDLIRLFGFGSAFDTFAEVIGAATDDGTDTTIDFGGGNTITLENTLVADLHQDDFLFG